MFLELSEVFVCPSCRPAQGLIVLVDAIEERRVREGHLGCPECEMRVPIRDGVLRFDRAREGGTGDVPAASLVAGVGREQGATRLAALLGADRAEGCLLLGPGLEALAEPLAGIGEVAEVLSLVPEAPGPDTPQAANDGERGEGPGEGAPRTHGVSRATGVDPGDLPVVTGRLAGVALLGPGRDAVREAVRVVEEGGRVVLLEPSREARRALEGEPVGVTAAEQEAVVAVRQAGAAPVRS